MLELHKALMVEKSKMSMERGSLFIKESGPRSCSMSLLTVMSLLTRPLKLIKRGLHFCKSRTAPLLSRKGAIRLTPKRARPWPE